MYVYEIRIQGHLDQHWATWFDGLTISYDGEDNTVLRGPLIDEAALHGVLIKVRDLALPLLALRREDADGPARKEQHSKTQVNTTSSSIENRVHRGLPARHEYRRGVSLPPPYQAQEVLYPEEAPLGET